MRINGLWDYQSAYYECVMDLLPQIIEVLFEDNEPNDKK